MVRRCRFIVEMGADAVICCHTHCPLPWEMHAGRPIAYGVGNLVMEAKGDEPHGWHEGYLARLTVVERSVRFEAIPYTQSNRRIGAEKMDQRGADQFFAAMHRKALQIEDGALLHEQWLTFCRSQEVDYLAKLFGYNRWMRKARSLLLRTLHSESDVLRALHYVQCESHREILNTIFSDKRRSG